MHRLVAVILVVLGLGLTAEAASALEIRLPPGEIDKLAGTNLQCLNDGVSVKCGTLILQNGGGYGFVPEGLYLSIDENNVVVFKYPSGGLGNPPLPLKNLAGGSLPPTLTQPQQTPRTTFAIGHLIGESDSVRPQWEETFLSDLIVRDNADASGQPFIFASKYSYPDAHVYPNTEFALLSATDAKFGHYTGLAGQIDSTFQQPHIPLPVDVSPIVTELVSNSRFVDIGLPKPLHRRATVINTFIFKMNASMKWSDDKAICAASKTFEFQVETLAREEAKPAYRRKVKPRNRHSLSLVKTGAHQLVGICK
jgi:hypothetical protein